MLVAGVGLKLLTGAATFGLTEIDRPTLRWTAADTVLASVQVPEGTNLFQIQTAPIEARLAALPAVAAARVSVALPHALTITISERVPILVWQVGDNSYLADKAGALFAAVDAAAAGAAHVPTVVDRRAASPSSVVLGATRTFTPRRCAASAISSRRSSGRPESATISSCSWWLASSCSTSAPGETSATNS